MATAQVIQSIRRKFRALQPGMNERLRRQWAAAEARELGRGGISAVARATGMSRTTITAGCWELTLPVKQREKDAVRIRRPGGRRRSLVKRAPDLLTTLEALLAPATRGDPESPWRWTCKSTAKLAAELTRQLHPVSDRTVAALLIQASYSLQANRKTREGTALPDRNAQFEYLSRW